MNQDERARMMTTQQHQTAYVCRCRFARKGALSYIGHLDLMRVLERAVRRAELPILYSQGYNPRPMMVFALPLGVGIDTLGDYVDVSMSVPVDIDEFITRVQKELPEGFTLVSGVSIDEPKRSLMSVVTCATYALDGEGITQALINISKMPELLVDKKSKGKIVQTDIRPLLIKMIPTADPNHGEVMVYAGSSKNLRPDILLNAAVQYGGMDREAADNCKVTRLELFGGEYPEITEIVGLV